MGGAQAAPSLLPHLFPPLFFALLGFALCYIFSESLFLSPSLLVFVFVFMSLSLCLWAFPWPLPPSLTVSLILYLSPVFLHLYLSVCFAASMSLSGWFSPYPGLWSVSTFLCLRLWVCLSASYSLSAS